MFLIVLLVLLSWSNAQWPLQNTGTNEDAPVSNHEDHSSYPYEPVSEWVENVPSLNLADVSYDKDNVYQRARISNNPNLKLPEIDNRMETILKALEFSDNAQASEDNENIESTDRTAKTLIKSHTVSSLISKAIGNVTLSRKSSVRDRVTNLVNQGSALRNDTDHLVDRLNLLYINLAISENDNELRMENSYKYGMSVILRFLFEFYRIFRRLSSQSTGTQLRLTNEKIDMYGLSYDNAVAVMKEKKNYSPLELSAPVRRSVDIFKSIIYESVILIQTKCSTMDPNWKCIIVYLANLISETMNCSNVWYHAFIHLLALDKIALRDSFVYKIANLDKFKELTYFENIFDFTIEKIQEYREMGRVQLTAEAVFFTMLADLQENGLLDCISIDYLYN